MIISMVFLVLNMLAHQPSSHIQFEFRMVSPSGKTLKRDEFCKEYKLMEAKRLYDFCSPQLLYYNDKQKKIRLSTGTVYSDVEFNFIHLKDTMTIRIINSGYGAIVNIDSLVFKPGIYAIKCNSRIVNGKTLPNLPVLALQQIDYDAAKADYYNFWLDEFKKVKDEDREGYATAKTLRRLQYKYHVNSTDLSYKTARQLN